MIPENKFKILCEKRRESKLKSYQRKQKTIQATAQFYNEIEYNNRIGSHVNCVRINTNNSLAHELRKCRVAYELIKLGHNIITEAKFTDNRGISDCVDLETGVCYEILYSETLDQLQEKTKKYPACFAIVPIDSKVKFNVGDLVE